MIHASIWRQGSTAGSSCVWSHTSGCSWCVYVCVGGGAVCVSAFVCVRLCVRGEGMGIVNVCVSEGGCVCCAMLHCCTPVMRLYPHPMPTAAGGEQDLDRGQLLPVSAQVVPADAACSVHTASWHHVQRDGAGGCACAFVCDASARAPARMTVLDVCVGIDWQALFSSLVNPSPLSHHHAGPLWPPHAPHTAAPPRRSRPAAAAPQRLPFPHQARPPSSQHNPISYTSRHTLPRRTALRHRVCAWQ